MGQGDAVRHLLHLDDALERARLRAGARRGVAQREAVALVDWLGARDCDPPRRDGDHPRRRPPRRDRRDRAEPEPERPPVGEGHVHALLVGRERDRDAVDGERLALARVGEIGELHHGDAAAAARDEEAVASLDHVVEDALQRQPADEHLVAAVPLHQLETAGDETQPRRVGARSRLRGEPDDEGEPDGAPAAPCDADHSVSR